MTNKYPPLSDAEKEAIVLRRKAEGLPIDKHALTSAFMRRKITLFRARERAALGVPVRSVLKRSRKSARHGSNTVTFYLNDEDMGHFLLAVQKLTRETSRTLTRSEVAACAVRYLTKSVLEDEAARKEWGADLS